MRIKIKNVSVINVNGKKNVRTKISTRDFPGRILGPWDYVKNFRETANSSSVVG